MIDIYLPPEVEKSEVPFDYLIGSLIAQERIAGSQF